MRQGIGVCILLFVLLGLSWWWSRAIAPTQQPVVEDLAAASAAPASGDVAAPRERAQRTAAEPVAAPDGGAEPAEAPSPEELWGRVVVAGSGAPVAGAEVVLRHRDADEFWNLDLDFGKRPPNSAGPAAPPTGPSGSACRAASSTSCSCRPRVSRP